MEPRDTVTPVCIEPRPERHDHLTSDVLVLDESCVGTGMLTRHVHHREFPEIRGEGETIRDCLVQLAFHLARAREHAREAWQRDAIDLAILDVTSYQHRDCGCG